MTHHYEATPAKHVDWKLTKAHNMGPNTHPNRLVLVVRKSRTNLGQSMDTPTLPFLYNFECDFTRMDTVNLTAKFEVHSFTRS